MDTLLEFMSNHPYLMTGALVLTAVAIANELRLVSRRGIDLGPNEAISLINRGAAVIDLRSFERYTTGHIVNAKNIPADELDAATKTKLKGLKDTAIIVYDDNGLSAAKAVGALRGLEYSQVLSLRGGIAAWQRENLPLEKGK